MSSPSLLALLFTLLLALLSALAFVLLYLRSPWAASAAAARGNKSHLHSHSHSHTHTNARTRGSSHSSGTANSAAAGNTPGQAYGAHGHSHSNQSHAHSHAQTPTKHTHAQSSGADSSSASGSAFSHSSHSHIHGSMAASSHGSSLPSHHAGSGAAAQAGGLSLAMGLGAGGAGSLTAADIALRGRKAKKRGGRVHVMLGAQGGGNAAPVPSVSSRGRVSSSGGPSPFVYPLDFLSHAPPVIVCLTTLPSRVHHIDKCLNSIKTQSYPITQMILVIPEESRRERTKYSIPDRVRKDAIMSVVRVSQDYGPATALISAWSAVPDDDASSSPSSSSSSSASAALSHRDTLLICLDDDMVYHPDTVSTLVRHALAHPDSALSFAGYSLRGPPYISPNLQYAKRREERPDVVYRGVQAMMQSQIQYAAASSALHHGNTSAALAAAAAAAANSPVHLSPHVLSSSLDPAILPCFDPLPDVPLESDPYSAPLPNPNDVYESEQVDVLSRWRGGMLVRKRFLDERMWTEYAQMPEAAMQADEEWISAQLCRNGITRRVILAPFDMILGRLRLRHGRHSASASHIAHQQTLLETLIERRWLVPAHTEHTGTPHGRSDRESRNGTAQRLDTAHSPTVMASSHSGSDAESDAQAEADEAAAQLRRLQQLIRVTSVDEPQQAAAEG